MSKNVAKGAIQMWLRSSIYYLPVTAEYGQTKIAVNLAHVVRVSESGVIFLSTGEKISLIKDEDFKRLWEAVNRIEDSESQETPF